MTNTMTVVTVPGFASRVTRATSRSSLIERLGALLEEYRRYRQTYAELERMTDRELADIGVSRLNIAEVAREAARLESASDA